MAHTKSFLVAFHHISSRVHFGFSTFLKMKSQSNFLLLFIWHLGFTMRIRDMSPLHFRNRLGLFLIFCVGPSYSLFYFSNCSFSFIFMAFSSPHPPCTCLLGFHSQIFIPHTFTHFANSLTWLRTSRENSKIHNLFELFCFCLSWPHDPYFSHLSGSSYYYRSFHSFCHLIFPSKPCILFLSQTLLLLLSQLSSVKN